MPRTVSNWAGVAGIASAIVTFSVVLLSEHFSAPVGQGYVAEGALIEDVSAGLWFVAGLFAFAASFRRRDLRVDLLLIGYVLLIFGFRELDFHTRFTPWNMGHLVKYTKDYIPIHVRLTGLLFVIAPLVTALVFLVTRWRRQLVGAWFEGRGWVGAMFWWVALLVLARVADKLSGQPRSFLGADDSWLFRAAEESLELGLALLTLLLVAGAIKRSASPAAATVPAGTAHTT